MQLRNRASTELILIAPSRSHEMGIIWRWIRQSGQAIVSFLSVNHEPSVSLKRDRSGETYWKIYDPVSRRQIYLREEREVRHWLESRYYSANSSDSL